MIYAPNMRNLSGLLIWLKTVGAQLGPKRLFALLLSKAINKLVNQFAIDSYSQFGEDRFIASFFVDKPIGFYVDIGFNHPIAFSNTWKLYLKGWRGLYVDANPSLITIFKKVRPKDIVLEEVVSSRRSRVDFYFSKVSDLISGVGGKTIGNWKRTNENCNVVSRVTHYYVLSATGKLCSL